MARKKIEIVTIEINGEFVEAKECTQCGEVKALSEYFKDIRGVGHRRPNCKSCYYRARQKGRLDSYKTLSDLYVLSNSELEGGNKMLLHKATVYLYEQFILNERTSIKASEITEFLNCSRMMYSKIMRELNPVLTMSCIVISRGVLTKTSRDIEGRLCSRCEGVKGVSEFRLIKSTGKYFPYCKDCERSYRCIADHKRNAKKRALPSDIICKDRDSFLSRFDYKCVLTSETDDIHLDHFIPLSWGRGGTTIENMIPLRGDLNTSKNDANPFEWIKREDIRQQIDMKRWEETVEYLANLNGMTAKEFEEYVYWCEENKRDLTATA